MRRSSDSAADAAAAAAMHETTMEQLRGNGLAARGAGEGNVAANGGCSGWDGDSTYTRTGGDQCEQRHG